MYNLAVLALKPNFTKSLARVQLETTCLNIEINALNMKLRTYVNIGGLLAEKYD